MRVTLAGYHAISIIHGGPLTQLTQTARHLADHGIEAQLFDPWAPFRSGECDLFHLFAANIGTYHLAREVVAAGVPLVTSPILYSRHSPAYLRMGLAATRSVQKFVHGVWSDYSLCADVCSWAVCVLPNTIAEATLVGRGLGVPQEKIIVVPNGVDERFLHADPSSFIKRYGIRDFVLNVGHIGPARKNVLRLIQALGSIDHPAVIIGRITREPASAACVREAAKYKNILLIDGQTISSEILASAYAACRVFALPSLYETPGIAALEAGLAGATVLITPGGGTREYFRDMAIYVDPLSVSSIRDAIVEALGRPKDGRLREHIHTHYLWSHVAAKTAEVYRQALGAR
jgi:glycosyltransferase involved in cell wall biosynthesis